MRCWCGLSVVSDQRGTHPRRMEVIGGSSFGGRASRSSPLCLRLGLLKIRAKRFGTRVRPTKSPQGTRSWTTRKTFPSSTERRGSLDRRVAGLKGRQVPRCFASAKTSRITDPRRLLELGLPPRRTPALCPFGRCAFPGRVSGAVKKTRRPRNGEYSLFSRARGRVAFVSRRQLSSPSSGGGCGSPDCGSFGCGVGGVGVSFMRRIYPARDPPETLPEKKISTKRARVTRNAVALPGSLGRGCPVVQRRDSRRRYRQLRGRESSACAGLSREGPSNIFAPGDRLVGPFNILFVQGLQTDRLRSSKYPTAVRELMLVGGQSGDVDDLEGHFLVRPCRQAPAKTPRRARKESIS